MKTLNENGALLQWLYYPKCELFYDVLPEDARMHVSPPSTRIPSTVNLCNLITCAGTRSVVIASAILLGVLVMSVLIGAVVTIATLVGWMDLVSVIQTRYFAIFAVIALVVTALVIIRAIFAVIALAVTALVKDKYNGTEAGPIDIVFSFVDWTTSKVCPVFRVKRDIIES